jgi:hypothetical protein
MDLHKIVVRPVYRSEEPYFKNKLQVHHYLGTLPKIGNTIWYIATHQNNWLVEQKHARCLRLFKNDSK